MSFASFRQSCACEWQRYTEHEFVARIGDGSLPRECFEHYLKQDYLFLLQFARAYGLAVFKSTTLRQMRQARDALAGILDLEIGLHVEYCRGWGLSEDALQREPEATATLAYTRFVLERGLAGNLADLHAALAPCVVGYAEIGARLAGAANATANPYREWIEMYASREYQDLARAEIAELDALCAPEPGAARAAELAGTFRDATRLEAGFWDMALAGAL